MRLFMNRLILYNNILIVIFKSILITGGSLILGVYLYKLTFFRAGLNYLIKIIR